MLHEVRHLGDTGSSEGIRVQRRWDRRVSYTAAYAASKALLGKVVQDGGRREPGELRAKPPKPFEVPPFLIFIAVPGSVEVITAQFEPP